jgi:hypothetical protein
VHRLVERAGPDHVASYAARLRVLVDAMADVIRLRTADDDVEGAYAALVATVG